MAQARMDRLVSHLDSGSAVGAAAAASTRETAGASADDALVITDARSGKTVRVPIENGTIPAPVLWSEFGIRSYDPAYTNTACASSAICYIDGPAGFLSYRGYPIEELAEKATFMEVTFLLIYGELPTRDQLEYFESRVMRHTFVHQDLSQMMKEFRYDAHPMGMLVTTVAALSTIHPEANPALAGQDVYDDVKLRNKQIHRVLGTLPTIAAYSYRHRMGRPYVTPSHQPLTYTENFLFMIDKLSNSAYRPHPRLAKALDVLFILHADHELNCSTAAMRHLASSGVDVYTGLAGAMAALYGPRHGGANEAVLRMLQEIGTPENVPKFIEGVKAGNEKLMGFGHRVYKNYDPRARIIRKVADEVFEILGQEPLIHVAMALEKHALSDEYFVSRKLYPNVDFYSGLIYKAMGFPVDIFPVLFAIPRAAGWLAHWNEFLNLDPKDPQAKIIRPRQVYIGAGKRSYVPIDQRTLAVVTDLESKVSAAGKRRMASQVPP